MDRNQPAPDLQPDNPAVGIENWSPQPSAVYDLQDSAAVEGVAKPTVDPITAADTLMEQRRDTTGGCAAQGNSPFEIAAHEVQHTAGDVRDNPDCSVALQSGQGQGGQPASPTMLPTAGGTPPSVLPVARPRQGT